MYPNDVKDRPVPATGYMPYFYQAGLFLSYDSPAQHARSGPDEATSASPQPSGSGLPTRLLDGFQTVEDVITRGYFAVPGGDPVTAIISDKMHTSHLGLDDVIGQIRNRYTLYEQNVYELDLAVCEVNNGLFRQVAAQGQPADNRLQYSASKAVQGIYEQKRTERVNLWRDLSRLKLGLPETAQSYLTAYRKVSALNVQPDDTP